jgi:hypothetical protein
LSSCCCCLFGLQDLLGKKNALKHIGMVLQQKLASLQQQQQQQPKNKA